MLKNGYFAAAVFFSCFCVLILVAIFAYSGAVLPSGAGMTRDEAFLMWLAWSGIAAFPVITAAWAIFQLRKGRRS